MSHVTIFSELAARFFLAEAQLRVALRADDATLDHARLLRRSASTLELIASHDPSSAEELAEMIDVFARLRTDGVAVPLNRMARLVSLSLPPLTTPTIRLHPLPDPLPDRLGAADLARLVVRGTGSLIVLGADKRVLAASAGYAARFHVGPTRLLGRHLLEVIGCGRWQVREMQRVEQAFAGRGQDEPDSAFDGTRLVRDPAGRPYAVICGPIANEEARAANGV